MDSSTKGLQDISFGGWEVVPDHVVKMMEAKNQYFAPSTLLGVNGLELIMNYLHGSAHPKILVGISSNIEDLCINFVMPPKRS